MLATLVYAHPPLPLVVKANQDAAAASDLWPLFRRLPRRLDRNDGRFCKVEYHKSHQNQIIKEKVLENSTIGSCVTFSLFHNLQNPLFQNTNGAPKNSSRR
jgi:hypothetical protein